LPDQPFDMIDRRFQSDPPAEPDTPTDEAERMQRIALRPDGYHWTAPDGHQEFGPFATLEEALADMGGSADESVEPGESQAEAEQELGIGEWLDPETGARAEDGVTRIEDH
jgi:hypothetical protein